MSAEHFDLSVVSAESSIYTGKARSITLRACSGELTIMPRHVRLLTAIHPGPAIVRTASEELILFLSGGFLEVQPDVVTVLADTAIRARDVDEAAAVKAQEEARALLAVRQSDIDYAKARSELARAAALIQTLQLFRSQLKR